MYFWRFGRSNTTKDDTNSDTNTNTNDYYECAS